MLHAEITDKIIKAFFKVYNTLGYGFLEKVYENALKIELEKNRLNVEKQKPMPIVYKDVKLDHGYRIDLLVEDKVVIELKTVDALIDVHEAQILTYLKLGDYKLGLLINFKVSLLKNGIRRFVNNL